MKSKLKFVIDNFEEIICCTALAITILSVLINILSGTFFGRRYGQLEELEKSAFVWMTYVGVSVCYKRKAHICVDFLVHSMPNNIKNVVTMLVRIAVLVFAFIIVHYGTMLTIDAVHKTLSLSKVPYYYINSAIVVGFSTMAVRSTIDIVKDIRNWKGKGECNG